MSDPPPAPSVIPLPALQPAPSVAETIAAFGTVVVSALVLMSFAIVTVIAVTRGLPDSDAMKTLLGIHGTLATFVVGYWCGSSRGSQKKDDTIAASQAALAVSAPVVPLRPAA